MARLYFPAPSDRVLRSRHWRDRITLEAIPYFFEYHYNERSGLWAMDLRDSANELLANDVTLVLDADLFAVHRHKAIPPGKVFVADSSGTGVEAGVDDLFTRVLVGYDESEAAA